MAYYLNQKIKMNLPKLINESKTYLFENMRSHIQKKIQFNNNDRLKTSVYKKLIKLNVK